MVGENKRVISLADFAKIIYKLQESDREVVTAVSGFTGEGKSTFSILLEVAHSKVSGLEWDLNRLTWSRRELVKWINGEGKSKEGQLPEFSSLISDELFMMFYKRNWFDYEQKEALAILKSCRDRHLFIVGNIPNFWELDKNFCSQVRFYVYIPQRGLAIVFQQENNAFSDDAWNGQENKKMFRKYKNYDKSVNFLFMINFPDLPPSLKSDYLKIRNDKRISGLEENKPAALERYKDISIREARLIQMVFELQKEAGRKLNNEELSKSLGISSELIRRKRQMVLPLIP